MIKKIEVVGTDTVALTTQDGKTKLLHNVQYIPSLAHNLLSVGQLMSYGYFVVFENDESIIKDCKTGAQLVNV